MFLRVQSCLLRKDPRVLTRVSVNLLLRGTEFALFLLRRVESPRGKGVSSKDGQLTSRVH